MACSCWTVRLAGLAVALLVAPAFGVSVMKAWSVRYDGPGHNSDEALLVAVGGDGSVYAAGSSYQSGQNDNLLLLKYSPEGTLLWDTVINGPANGNESAGAIALDGQGNILIVGPEPHSDGFYRTLWKFEPVGGTLLWSYSLPESEGCRFQQVFSGGLAVLPDDAILFGGCGFEVVKLSPGGDVIWSASTQPAADVDLITSIAIAGDGRVLCGGVATDAFAGSGVVAYDADGNFLWSDVQTGSHGAVFGPARVAFDELGNAIAAFEPETSCGVFGLLLVKYDATGAFAWSTAYAANPCASFLPAGLVVADADQIYIVGSIGGAADIATVKFDASGGVAWSRMHDGPLGSTDIGEAITLDAAGNVYVVGTELNTGPQDRDIVSLSYDPAGNLRWAVSEGSLTNANDSGSGIALHGCGRIYAAGHGWNGVNSEDAFLVRYDQPIPADFDADGDGDMADFAILQANFGTSSGADPSDGDVDGDGDVDFADFVAALPCIMGPL